MGRTNELEPPVGVEVEGLDARAASPADGAWLRELLDERPLVVLRGQELDAPALVAFTRLLGEPLRHPPHPAYPDLPEVAPISNRADRGRPTGPYWHTDGLLRPDPPALTAFYAAEVPECGGDTLFADAFEAFESLEPEDRDALDGLVAVFETGTRHPLVRTHPRSGRRGLNANLGATVGIVGIERDSAKRLFAQLIEHLERPGRTYRHRYRRGDLVIWDNVGVVHSATEQPPPDSPRLMLRTDVSA